jgi:hypothetical protein
MLIFRANRVAIYDSVIGRTIPIHFVGTLPVDVHYFLSTSLSFVQKRMVLTITAISVLVLLVKWTNLHRQPS